MPWPVLLSVLFLVVTPGLTLSGTISQFCRNTIEKEDEPRSHFVIACIIDKAFGPVVLLGSRVFSDRGAGILDDLIIDIDWTVHAQSQGDCVARSRIDHKDLAAFS